MPHRTHSFSHRLTLVRAAHSTCYAWLCTVASHVRSPMCLSGMALHDLGLCDSGCGCNSRRNPPVRHHLLVPWNGFVSVTETKHQKSRREKFNGTLLLRPSPIEKFELTSLVIFVPSKPSKRLKVDWMQRCFHSITWLSFCCLSLHFLGSEGVKAPMIHLRHVTVRKLMQRFFDLRTWRGPQISAAIGLLISVMFQPFVHF